MVQVFDEVDTHCGSRQLSPSLSKACTPPLRLSPVFRPPLTLFHSVSLFHTFPPMVVDMCLADVSDSVSPALPHSSI